MRLVVRIRSLLQNLPSGVAVTNTRFRAARNQKTRRTLYLSPPASSALGGDTFLDNVQKTRTGFTLMVVDVNYVVSTTILSRTVQRDCQPMVSWPTSDRLALIYLSILD